MESKKVGSQEMTDILFFTGMATGTGTWEVYYQHWAKEQNEIRKQEFQQKSIVKTIKILWCWFTQQSDSDVSDLRFEECADDLVKSLKFVLKTLVSVNPKKKIRDQMEHLGEIVEKLVPPHTPSENSLFVTPLEEFEVIQGQIQRGSDTLPFHISPMEYRFLRNFKIPLFPHGDRDEFQLNHISLVDMDLSPSNMRNLEAIVAFL